MRLGSIELDDDFQWVNEFSHNPVEQTREHSITGALLVQEGLKLHGRSIDLRSNGGVWTTLSVVRELEALRDQPSVPMELVLPDGREFMVIWDRSGSPLTAEPVERETYATEGSLFYLDLKLITVQA